MEVISVVLVLMVLILVVLPRGMACNLPMDADSYLHQNTITCNPSNGVYVAHEGRPLKICPLRGDNITLKITIVPLSQGGFDSGGRDFETSEMNTLLDATQPCAIIPTVDDNAVEPIEHFHIILTVKECPNIPEVICDAVIIDNDGLNSECRDIVVANKAGVQTSMENTCSPSLNLYQCTEGFSLSCSSLDSSDISNVLANSESINSFSTYFPNIRNRCIKFLRQSLLGNFANLTASDDSETNDLCYINCSVTFTHSSRCSAFIYYLERVDFRRIPNIRSNTYSLLECGVLEISCCLDSLPESCHSPADSITTDSITTVSPTETTAPQPVLVATGGAGVDTTLIGGVVGVVAFIILTILMIVLLACFIVKRRGKRVMSRDTEVHNISRSQPIPANAEHIYYTDTEPYSQWKVKFAEFVIDSKQLDNESMIGEGEFSVVWRARCTSIAGTEAPPTLVAIKKLKDHYEIEKFISESELMLSLDHPNILNLVGMCFNMADTPAAIILPYMGNGDLQIFLATRRETMKESKENYPTDLSESVLLRMCMDIARGMHYLAKCKLVHRDLAARNCMVDDEMRVKVADFGLSRDVQITDYYRLTHRQRLPVKWMAPESLFKNIFSEKSDVWSYGIVCWEIFKLGKKPFSGVDNQDMPDHISEGFRPKKPSRCPSALYDDIMWKTWMEDPLERPNFESVVKSLASLMKYDGDIAEDLEKETANCVAKLKHHLEFLVADDDNTDKENIYSEVVDIIYSNCSQKEQTDAPIEYEVPVLSYQKSFTPVDYVEIPQLKMERRKEDKNREASSTYPHHKPTLLTVGNSPQRSPGPPSQSKRKHESQRRASPKSDRKLPPYSNPTPNSTPTSEKTVMELNSDHNNANNHHYHILECSPSD